MHVESVLILLFLIGKWLIRRITLQSAVPVAIFQSSPVQLLGFASTFHPQSQTAKFTWLTSSVHHAVVMQPRSLEQLRNIDQPLRYQFSTVYNCITYVVVSSAYVCSTCDTGFTLSTLNSVKVCMRNDLIDGNCTTYALNAQQKLRMHSLCNWIHSFNCEYHCGSDKTMSFNNYQIIRDCSVYEISQEVTAATNALQLPILLVICSPTTVFQLTGVSIR
jgi:hypothetical protein